MFIYSLSARMWWLSYFGYWINATCGAITTRILLQSIYRFILYGSGYWHYWRAASLSPEVIDGCSNRTGCQLLQSPVHHIRRVIIFPRWSGDGHACIDLFSSFPQFGNISALPKRLFSYFTRELYKYFGDTSAIISQRQSRDTPLYFRLWASAWSTQRRTPRNNVPLSLCSSIKLFRRIFVTFASRRKEENTSTTRLQQQRRSIIMGASTEEPDSV